LKLWNGLSAFQSSKTGRSRKDLMNFFIGAQINGWVDRVLDFYELIFGEGHVKWMMKRNNEIAVGVNQQLFILLTNLNIYLY